MENLVQQLEGIVRLSKPLTILGAGRGICDVTEVDGEVVEIVDDGETSVLSYKQLQALLRYRSKKAARNGSNGNVPIAGVVE